MNLAVHAISAAALMLTVVGSVPAIAEPVWSSAAPIQYLQYDLAPYYSWAAGSLPAYQYWRPKSRLAVKSLYSGLYDYAQSVVVNPVPMVEAAPLPYIGYDMTPYYNLAPGCPLSSRSDDSTHIC